MGQLPELCKIDSRGNLYLENSRIHPIASESRTYEGSSPETEGERITARLTRFVRNANNRTKRATSERTKINCNCFCGVFDEKPRIFHAHIEPDLPLLGVKHRANPGSNRGFYFFVSAIKEPDMTQQAHTDSPATLFAIIVAAHRVGNRELEREMRRQLEQRFQVKLSFVRKSSFRKGGDDAK